MNKSEVVSVIELRDIRCPVCSKGKLVMEKKNFHNISLQIYLPEDKNKAKWFVKCSICKSQIGFNIVTIKK